MKRIGIFGGTFNPPHLAHSRLAEEVRKSLKLDKIIIVPSAVPPLKSGKEVIEIKHRLAMAEIAFGENPGFEISDIEIKRNKTKSYTIDTLIKLNKKIRDDSVKFYLILGTDSLIDFPKWKTPERLFDYAEVVAINRPGYKKSDIKPEYSERVLFIKVKPMNISSTKIREYVRSNKPIGSLVLPEIEKYIEQNKLYK